MAKKRQQDFQKTKLRVGRSLPKGRNVTDTSFSSNKILVHQDITVQQPSSSKRDVDDVVKGLNRNNAHTLVRVLNQCKNLEQNELVTNYISLLNRVLDLTYDIDHDVRVSAINTLRYILAFTTDAKLSNVFSLLTKSLSCAMTHTNFEVRQDSLVMFDAILSSHPGLLWTHKIFLNHLLGMLSRTHSTIDTRKRRKTLDDSLNEDMTAQAWRMKVLAQMSNFLEVILKNLLKKENDTDNEQEVHWDGKKPLFVPIYAGSGLKPFDIESPDHCLKSSHCYWKPDIVKSFTLELVPLMTSIFMEEVIQFQDLPTKESLPPQAPQAQNLNTLLQIFHCLGKWIKSMPKHRNEVEEYFSGTYGNVINTSLMKHFPFGQKIEEPVGRAKTSKKIKPPSSLELNLRICCLYSLFVLETQYSHSAMDRRILEYLEGVFAMSYEECFANIPFLVEITKNYLSCGDDEGIKCSFLKGLCGKLNCQPSDSSQKELQAFFVELSLNVQYRGLVNTPEMKLWYTLLLDQLNKMMEINHMDKRLLKDIRKICCRQYPNFVECLQDIKPEEYLKLLKCENEDFQETVVCLIYHTKCLSPEFLQDIAEIILLSPSFSFRTASRIIVMLAHRFSGPNVPDVDQVIFIKFLLNIACDTVSMEDIPQNCDEIVQFMVKKFEAMRSFSTFEIFPSLGWEKHSRLYDVCINSLQLFPEPRKSLNIRRFLQTVLERVRIPLHSAIAVLKLKTDFSASSYISQDEALNSIMHELVFSSLVYTSLLSSYGAGWQKYAIPELSTLLDLNQNTAFETVRHMKSEVTLYNVDFAYLCLRICGYFITHKMLVPDNKMEMIPLLKNLEVFCSENADYSEYFVNVCNYFGYYRRHPLVIKSE